MKKYENKEIRHFCMMCMLILGIGGCSWKQNQDMAERSAEIRKFVVYLLCRNKFLCYNSVDDLALTGMGFSRNNQETTVRLS